MNQLKLALIDAPLSLRRLDHQSARNMAIYLFLGIILFASFSATAIHFEPQARQLILDYLFPQTWHGISQKLFDFFFESQAKAVLANAVMSGALVVASLFLFPLKERFSAAFEQDGKYENGCVEEFPLSYQIVEEAKLLLVYIASQLVILWIGYYPGQLASVVSTTLSYLFLFFTFAVDIISPVLQRHRTRYSVIGKLLIKKPLLALSFGALFSFPPILLGFWVFAQAEMTLIQMSVTLFLVTLLMITIAIPAGTHIGSILLREARSTKPIVRRTRRWLYLMLWLTLFVFTFLHSRLVLSLHHKSQLLKLNYDIDWSSIEFNWQSLGDLFTQDNKTNFSVKMAIDNPTPFDLVIEPSDIRVYHQQVLVSNIHLDGFAIASMEQRQVNLKLDALSNFSSLESWQSLTNGWHSDLSFELWPGIPFVIELSSLERQTENTD